MYEFANVFHGILCCGNMAIPLSEHGKFQAKSFFCRICHVFLKKFSCVFEELAMENVWKCHAPKERPLAIAVKKEFEFLLLLTCYLWALF